MEGSEFIGWFINDNTNVAPVKDYKIPAMTQEDVKLTANWKVLKATLPTGTEFNKVISSHALFKNMKEIHFKKEKFDTNTELPYLNYDVGGIFIHIVYNINENILEVISEYDIYANEDSSKIFANLDNITKITFENFNTVNVRDMSNMFYGCSSLINLDLSSFDTSNVKDMHAVFKDCASLTNLNLNGWNVNNVTTMKNMFYGCSSLINLDLSSFKTASLTNTGLMFTNCSKLENIKGIEKFDTNDITDMYNMFQNCTKLSGSITIMNPHTANYDIIFSNCSTSTSSKFIVNYIGDFTKTIAKNMVATKSTNSNVVLGGIPSTLVDGSTFNSTIKGMSGFANITEIRFEQKSGTLRGTDVSEAKDGSIKARISGNILYVESNGEIFANKDCTSMFYEFGYHFGVNELLNKIIFNNFNTEKVTAMDNMFFSCMALTSLDVSNWDTSKVTDMNSMFGYCYTLQSVNVSNFDTSQVADMGHMFNGCGSLTSIKGIESFDTSQVTNMNSMFKGCSSLTSIKGIESFDTSQVADMSSMFSQCNSLTSLDVSNFNTSKVTDMSYMFFDCYLLTSLDLSKWNTKKLSNIGDMFKGCSSLTSEITISNPNITIKYGDMFLGCSTVPSAKFIVKYTDEATKTVAEKMVATKSSNSNVYLDGTQPIPSATLMNGTTFNSTIKSMPNFDNVTKIRFIKGTPSSGGTDVSEARDGRIKAYIEGNILTVACEGEIIANADCYQIFYQNKYTKIEFKNFNTSQVTNMSYMFYDCSSLTEIKGLETWDTSNVTNMQNMFGINALINLDVSKFDTSKVIYMNSMFEGSPSLTNIIGLENFDTSQVTNMNYMLDDCPYLSGSITIMNPNITDYRGMFKITATDSSAKFVVKYTDDATKEVARQMVATKSENCNVFLCEEPSTLVDGQTFNSTIKSMPNFANLTEIRFIQGTPNPNGTDVSQAQDKSIMANIEGNILTVACEGEIFANKSCVNMFYSFGSQYGTNKVLNKITFNNFNTSKVTDISVMFNGCHSLTNLDVSKWDTSQVTDMSTMFNACEKLTEIRGLENFDTSQVTDMSYMFTNCAKLNGSITIMNPNITNYGNMFTNCSIDSSSKFVVNYTSGCQNLATNMVATQYDGSKGGNVVLGTQKSLLNEAIPNKEEPSVPDTVILTIKDGNITTMKEILAGEIGSLNIPSKEGMAFSGYFYDAEFTKPVSERDVISEDTTIYIKWEEVPQEEVPQNEEIPQEENKDENLEIA